MTRRRFQQLPPERREEILSLAAAEFARSGFAGTSYNQLLARLGLGKGSAYYYFDDKRDLFLAVLESCYARYFEHISSLELPKTRGQFWSYVEQTTLLGFEYMSHDPVAAGLMRCLEKESALLGELNAQPVLASMTASYRDLLSLGQKLGAVRCDLPLPLLIEISRGLAISFDRWFVFKEQDRPPDLETISCWFTDAARRLVGVEPPAVRARARAKSAP